MVTQFILRTDKKDKAGRCPVYLIVYFDGARLKCATGEKCKLADWNADRQQFRRTYPLAEEANQLLARLTADVLSWWRVLRAAGEAPTLAGLRAVLRPAPAPEAVVVEQQSVTVWYDEYRVSMKARGYAFETLRHNLVTRNWMAGFEKWSGQLLDPTTYSMELHDRLLLYLREERGLAPNSVATAIKDLKTFLRWLRDERGVAVGLDISKLQHKDLRRAEAVPVGLGLGEAGGRDAASQLGAHARRVPILLLHGAKLLGCGEAARGQPARLERGAAAEANDEQDAGRREHLPNGGGLGHLGQICRCGAPAPAAGAPEPGDEQVSEAGGEAGRAYGGGRTQGGGVVRAAVPRCELVTMHTARHTFATQSLLRGMPVEILQKILGHKKVQTTLIYAKIVEDFQPQTMWRVWEGTATPSDGQASGGICEV